MDEVLIICVWPNQINYAKFNLYDYSLVAAITLCCYAYTVRCCNLVLIGTHICFVVNCKSSYAISTMLVCVACAKVITPYSNNFLSCPFPKLPVYRYLYECYLCSVLLCIFMTMLCGRYLHECLFVWCCCVNFMALSKMLCLGLIMPNQHCQVVMKPSCGDILGGNAQTFMIPTIQYYRST